MVAFKPRYLQLLQSGELAERITRAYDILASCTLCPRACGINRLEGEIGFCGAGNTVTIGSTGPHFGEEPPLSGSRGAGTIFFTYCSLKCCYCQNYQISHAGIGRRVEVEDLAQAMLRLQDQGCHNIDLVTPGHIAPFVLKAIQLAAERGLAIPLVYNSGGYDSIETLRLLDGIVDVYLPDWKYGAVTLAQEYSHAPDYPTVCEQAIAEMYRQVGDLQVDRYGIAWQGLIVRHLVLPNHVDNTKQVLERLAYILPETTRVSLMAQYVPCFQAQQHPSLQQPLSAQEYEIARKSLEQRGFLEYWVQELESANCYLPNFMKENPFVDGAYFPA
jgi:putative pyruvate formate lyase activating enzyme